MHEIAITTAGNITREPELRFTKSGQPVATVGLAVNDRRYNPDTRQWVDGTATFLDATVWGEQARHVTESLHVGHRVVVIGRLVTRTYTPDAGPHAGEEQRRLEIVVDEMTPSLALGHRSGDQGPARGRTRRRGAALLIASPAPRGLRVSPEPGAPVVCASVFRGAQSVAARVASWLCDRRATPRVDPWHPDVVPRCGVAGRRRL
jgi:single-strand DNA-binding protein